MTMPDKRVIKNVAGWIGIGAMILGPLWGYAAMLGSRQLGGGSLADTLTFYLMIVGWMIMPPGILLLLYRLVLRAILNQRRDIKH